METIIRNVRELPSEERRVYEAAVGRALQENQQVLIQVITPPEFPAREAPSESVRDASTAFAALPDWCDVYAGLTEDEIVEVERIALTRSEMTRSFH